MAVLALGLAAPSVSAGKPKTWTRWYIGGPRAVCNDPETGLNIGAVCFGPLMADGWMVFQIFDHAGVPYQTAGEGVGATPVLSSGKTLAKFCGGSDPIWMARGTSVKVVLDSAPSLGPWCVWSGLWGGPGVGTRGAVYASFSPA